MLLAQIEGFLEVARRGNVSRAAEAMFVTQPTLTARLHALERELGEPLFARTRRGMRLTDAGQMEEYFRSYYMKCDKDERGVQSERKAMNFATVADRVQLIEDGWSTPLVVPWGDAMERVRRHEQAPTRETARALQRYIVQVPKTAFEKGILSGAAVYRVGDSLHVLSPTHTHLYDRDFGLLIGEDE